MEISFIRGPVILLPCFQPDARLNRYKPLTSVYENDYHSFLTIPLLHEIETLP